MFVAIKDGKKMYVGASSADSLLDMSRRDMVLEENVALWEIPRHPGWYIAGERFYVEMDRLRYADNLFTQKINYQSLLSHTIPKMKELLTSYGLVKDRSWENELLIIGKDKAYGIDSYFCVTEIEEFTMAGFRSDIMRGCLEFTKGMPAKTRICEAIHSVEEMRGRCNFPAVILDVETGRKEIWWSYEDALKKVKEDAMRESDEMYKKALLLVMQEGNATMSLLQRKLSIGYNRAGRLIERMEEDGYIEKFTGESSRKVLISQAQFDEKFNG